MSHIKKETLSALFDGETSDFETQRLLQGLDDEDKKTWRRYQILHMAANKTLTDDALKFDVSDAVAKVIASEPVPSPRPEDSKSSSGRVPTAGSTAASAINLHWLKPMVGFAAAASVAFFVVVGVNQKDPFVSEGNLSATKHPVSTKSGLMPVSAKIVHEDAQTEGVRQRQFNEFYREHFLRNGDKTLIKPSKDQ